MMQFDGEDLRKEYEAAFGKSVETLTQAQLWWLVKFAKHVRGRCRSNAALNSYLNRNFRHATFKEVTKQGPQGSYEGLEITMRE